MRIGIIVYSRTGNTLSVAERLKKEMSGPKRSLKIERVSSVGDKEPTDKDFRFESNPAVKGFDAVIFGAPVHGFRVAPIMKSYLEQLEGLEGKKVALYTTKALPMKWTGGTGTIKQMKRICISKGARVIGTGVVSWKESHREKDIKELIEGFKEIF